MSGPTLPFIHPDAMPDRYALTGYGTCMAPFINDGDCIAFDKREQPQQGDLVGIIFSQPAGKRRGLPGLVKRLVATPAQGFGDVFIVEQVNPPRRFSIPATDVLAVHTMIGICERDANGRAMVRLPKEIGAGS